MRLILDTHALLWWATGEGSLSPDQLDAIDRAESSGERLGVSAITFWEIAKLVERGRLSLRCSPDVLLDGLEESPALAVLPLTPRIALESTRLGPVFPADPSDQIIAATARVHGLRLVTADRRIRDSGAVPIL